MVVTDTAGKWAAVLTSTACAMQAMNGQRIPCYRVVADVEEEYYVDTLQLLLFLILRGNRQAWTGDSWNVQEFIGDLEALVENEGLVETESVASLVLLRLLNCCISIAAARISRKAEDAN